MKSRRLTILVIDDDPNDRALIAAALSSAAPRLKIHSLSHGGEAIDYLSGSGKYANREQFPFPGYIITDLKMAPGDGFDVLDFLKRNPELSIIPVLVLSGAADEDDIRHAYQLGASAFIQKPPDQAGLTRRLKLLYEFFKECEVAQVTSAGAQLPTESHGKIGARFHTAQKGN